MELPATLGVDIGSHGVRACLVGANGAEPVEVVELFDRQPPLRRDPSEWWTNLVRCLSRLDRVQRDKVAAVAVTGVRGSIAGFSADGVPVTPGYPDFEPACAAVTERFPPRQRERIRSESGCPIFLLSGLPKILLHRGDRAIRWWFAPQDYVGWRCTGQPAQSVGAALRMGVLDKEGERVHRALMEELGVDWRTIPPVKGIGQRLGTLEEASARELGLTAGIPVIAAPGDVSSAAVGAGVTRLGSALMSFGTSTVVSAAVADEDICRSRPDMTCEIYPDGQRSLELGAGAGGVTFDWLARVTGRSLDQLAGGSLVRGDASGRLRVEPELMSAWADDAGGGEIRGISPDVTVDALVDATARAIAERAVGLLRDLEACVGEVETVAVTGGAARFPRIGSRLEELVPKAEITVLTGRELAAYGSAVVAASALCRRPVVCERK